MEEFYYVCVKKTDGKYIVSMEILTRYDNLVLIAKDKEYIGMYPCLDKNDCEMKVHYMNLDYAKLNKGDKAK